MNRRSAILASIISVVTLGLVRPAKSKEPKLDELVASDIRRSLVNAEDASRNAVTWVFGAPADGDYERAFITLMRSVEHSNKLRVIAMELIREAIDMIPDDMPDGSELLAELEYNLNTAPVWTPPDHVKEKINS